MTCMVDPSRLANAMTSQGRDELRLRYARIAYDQLGIEFQVESHPAALRAGSLTAIEGEKPGVQGLVAYPTLETEEALIIDMLPGRREQMDHPVSQAQPLLHNL